jgi:hypothetical protein
MSGSMSARQRLTFGEACLGNWVSVVRVWRFHLFEAGDDARGARALTVTEGLKSGFVTLGISYKACGEGKWALLVDS